MGQKKVSALRGDFDSDFPVDLTLSRIPSGLLIEFFEKIVNPYYSGSLNRAATALMQKAIMEQEFVRTHTLIAEN